MKSLKLSDKTSKHEYRNEIVSRNRKDIIKIRV